MGSMLKGESIYANPDHNKEYQLAHYTKLTNITLLMKWIILYKKHPELLPNIKELIKTTNDINNQCSEGFTALMLASIKGHKVVVRLLLEHSDINVNLQNVFRYTALILASSYGHDAVVRLLLEHPDINVNLQNNYGYTALMYASMYGHEAVVRLLLEHPDINVNLQNYCKDSALSHASIDGHVVVVRLLLEHPTTDPTLQDIYGLTVLGHIMNEKLRILCEYSIYEWDNKQQLIEREKEDLMERIDFSIKYFHKVVRLSNTTLYFCLYK